MVMVMLNMALARPHVVAIESVCCDTGVGMSEISKICQAGPAVAKHNVKEKDGYLSEINFRRIFKKIFEEIIQQMYLRRIY